MREYVERNEEDIWQKGKVYIKKQVDVNDECSRTIEDIRDIGGVGISVACGGGVK